jgi:hypothetical protein
MRLIADQTRVPTRAAVRIDRWLSAGGGLDSAHICPPRPVLLGRTSHEPSAGKWPRRPRRAICSRSSRQRLEERARVTEVGGLEAFGEPGIDRVQHGPGACAVVLLMEQPRQTRRGA